MFHYTFQKIERVKIFKRPGGLKYFHDVELCIGDMDKGSLGNVHLGDGNSQVGFFKGPDTNISHTFTTPLLPNGRYLTLQGIEKDHLFIDEVQV